MTALLRTRRALALPLLFPWLLFPSPPPALAPEAPVAGELTGVVVESVGGWTLEKAGVQAGDVLLSWKRLPTPPANPEAAEGVLAGYFDWEELLIEQAPRGTVVLSGRRGEEVKEWTVEPGLWDAKVRPVLSPELVAIYERGKAPLSGGDIEDAVATWRQLVEAVPEGDGRDLKTWMLLRMGEAWGEKGEWEKAVELAREGMGFAQHYAAKNTTARIVGRSYAARNSYAEAEAAYSEALRHLRQRIEQSLREAALLNDLAEAIGDRGDLSAARELLLQGLEASTRLAPESLLMARTLNNLGVEAAHRGDFGQASNYLDRALVLRQGLAPQSEELAEVFNNLAVVANGRSDLAGAEDLHRASLTIRARIDPLSLATSNTLNNLCVLSRHRGELVSAGDYCRRALAIRDRLAPLGPGVATSLYNLALLARDEGELGVASSYLKRAHLIRQRLAPRSLGLATVLNLLGEIAKERGDLEEASSFLVQAFEMRKELAPTSLSYTVSLNNLGALAEIAGRDEEAEGRFLEALEIQTARYPRSATRALTLENLGALALKRGHLALAESYYLEALRLEEALSRNGIRTASILGGIGAVHRDRGDLDRATSHLGRAVRIGEQLTPTGSGLATNLNKLGTVELERGRPQVALQLFRRALEIDREIANRSADTAASLNNLGTAFLALGDLVLARESFEGSLRLKERINPTSLAVATSLNNLGALALDSANKEVAKAYLERSVDLQERNSPGSLEAAVGFHNSGRLFQSDGDFERAAEFYARALRIKEQVAPGGLTLARTLKDSATLERARGLSSNASRLHQYSLQVLENQFIRLGGSYEVGASFRSQHREYYFDFLSLLLTQKNHAEAFHTLERYRAQTFLAMLAERDIAFSADIPEELDRERRRVGVLYDRTLKKLGGLNPRDHPQEIEAAREELRRLEDEAGDIEVRIRKASPRLAALRYPEPFDAEKTREALDPGTLLLSWSVGKERSALFTLGHDAPLEAHILPVGEEALRAKVAHLLAVLPEARGGSSVAALRQSQLETVGRELFDLLLAPARERLANAERLLLLPDGPLHALPFGALRHPVATEKGQHEEFLAAWKPLHVALSATVYAELKGRRRAEPSPLPLSHEWERGSEEPGGGALARLRERDGVRGPIAAFGDPVYPRDLPKAAPGQLVELPLEAGIDPVVRGATERGLFDWEPLPYTRREVEGIAALFPPGTVQTFLGPEALEERLKSLGRNTRILHVAAHAGIDEHLPSGSFIALTVPPEASEVEDQTAPAEQPVRDNGLLQVWEIVERVRLDADLVVLSACESGLGKELGGEGMIGLTRAFQYAGARSVVASLWSVNDQATAELMIRFYRHLRDGKTKDEALRAAQRELIEGPIEITDERGEKKFFDASAPYYWAAFQVYGDWQ